MSRAVAHVWLDDFFVAVERRHAPALNARPLVIGGHRDASGRVVAASREARAAGVRVGQTLRHAAQHCPAAVFLPGHVERLLDARARVDEVLCEMRTGVEWLSLDEAVVDLGPTGGGAARRLAEQVQQRVADAARTPVAVGVAASLTAARVAARRARPGGLVLVLPGYDGRFLSECDITEQDLPDVRLLARLRSHHVTTFGALATLPDDTVRTLLGRAAAAVSRAARGADAPGALRPAARPRRVVRGALCDGARGGVIASLHEVVDEVRAALWAHRCAAHRVGVRVEDGHGAAEWARADLPRPAAAADELWQATSPLLARVAPLLPHVREVVVSASELTAVDTQASLFGVVSRVLDAGLPARSPRSPYSQAVAGMRRPHG